MNKPGMADTVLLDIIDEKLVAQSPYRDGDPQRYRRAGGRYSPKDRSWRYQLTMESCRALRREFGDRLYLSPQLSAWAWEEREREERIEAIVKANDATLLAVPHMSAALDEAMGNRKYQRVAARYIAEMGHVLIADQPGLGKTLEAIGGLMEANLWRGPILVAAPLTSLHTVWQTELDKFAPSSIVTIGVPMRGDNLEARRRLINGFKLMLEADKDWDFAHVLVVNPEMLRDVKVGEEPHPTITDETVPIYEPKYPELIGISWQAVVLDESHRYLSGVRSATDLTLMGKAMLRLELTENGKRMALSGTPLRGKPKNLWGTLHWLRPDLYRSYWIWADRYLNVIENAYGKSVGGILPQAEADLYKSLDRIMLRRTKAEVVKELPPKQYIDLVCDLAPTQRKQYESMAREAFAELGDEKISAVGVLAIMTRLKQMATCTWAPRASGKPEAFMHPKTSGKTAMIEQMLMERGIAGDDREGTDKIVIASQFTEVIESLGDYLTSINVEYLEITGKVSEAKRVRATNTFQSEHGPRVMLMNTRAGGVSITLDAYCSELIIIDETWVPDDQEQLEDRIHRVSRIHQVMVYRMSSVDTIDDHIRLITEDKDKIQKTLLDGRRGVEFAKLLATTGD